MRSRFNKRIHNTKYHKININPVILIKISIVIILYFVIFMSIKAIAFKHASIAEFAESVDELTSKNYETVFKIDEIVLYSSASARINSQTSALDISRIY